MFSAAISVTGLLSNCLSDISHVWQTYTGAAAMVSQPPDQPAQPSVPRGVCEDELPQQAVALAERLLRTAREQQTPAEREQAERLARMMADQEGKELTIALVDQAFRSHHPGRIADQLRHLLDSYGTPSYMDWWERAA